MGISFQSDIDAIKKVIREHKKDLTAKLLDKKVVNGGRIKLWYMDELGLTKPDDNLSERQHMIFILACKIIEKKNECYPLKQMELEAVASLFSQALEKDKKQKEPKHKNIISKVMRRARKRGKSGTRSN